MTLNTADTQKGHARSFEINVHNVHFPVSVPLLSHLPAGWVRTLSCSARKISRRRASGGHFSFLLQEKQNSGFCVNFLEVVTHRVAVPCSSSISSTQFETERSEEKQYKHSPASSSPTLCHITDFLQSCACCWNETIPQRPDVQNSLSGGSLPSTNGYTTFCLFVWSILHRRRGAFWCGHFFLRHIHVAAQLLYELRLTKTCKIRRFANWSSPRVYRSTAETIRWLTDN